MQEYVINPSTGILTERNITERIMGDVFTSLRASIMDQGILVPQVLPRLDVMFLQNKQILVAQRLTELPFHTSFELDSAHKVVWASFKPDSQTSVEMNIKWKAPADMHIMLVGKGPLYEYQEGTWNFYLVAVCEQSKKFDATKQSVWMLPLPNQHTDGRMCFNVNLVSPRDTICGWPQVFDRALELMSTAKWVADPLFSEWKIVPAKKLFRWKNETGFPQLDPPADITHWTKCCKPVSVPSLTEFFKQWSTAYDVRLF